MRYTLLRGMLAAVFLMLLATVPATAQEATPDLARSCADVTGTPAAMPGMGHGAGHGAMASTPDMGHGAHGMPMAEFDLMYIDMMIPHHESIIALATVAVDELEDPRLVAIAEAIITTQTAENAEMLELRDAWYPDAAPVTMEEMMGMPGMGDDMMVMEQQMDAEYQVQAFCAAEDRDLAFIDQVIPHHQMAIDTSIAARENAVHPELVAIAEDVISAQEAEIAELEAIRAELTGEATPAG